MEFTSFKEWFAAECKTKDACRPEFKKLLASENWQEILNVLKENAYWCYENGIINADVLSEKVPDEILLQNGIYVKKENIEQRDGLAIYYSSSSEHYGSSSSEHYDSSSSEHYDSSSSKHYGSSSSKHYDSSSSKHYYSSSSEHYGSSSSEHYGSSSSKHYDSSSSKHYDSSSSKHYDSSSSKHYDSSSSKHYDSESFGSIYNLDPATVHDKAIVRERSSGKVYIKKSAFEIIEL